jgi:shikimate dehydrogenase
MMLAPVNKYAVVGNPIQHSKSPIIHQAFAQQEGVEIEYQRMLSETSNFITDVNHFHTNGGMGLNVTLPFKVSAYEHCVSYDDYAKAAQAVNTISFNSQGEWLGANTDGIGLLRDLTDNQGVDLGAHSILILGAGGSVRGILLPLLLQKPAKIVIANRSVDKAITLAEQFSAHGNISACGYDDLTAMTQTSDQQCFDVVINATSASLSQQLPPISDSIVDSKSFCYDLAYSDTATVFMQWAQQRGVHGCCDGIGMLIEQAAESYAIWRGVYPDTQPVFKLLRP